MRGSPGAWMWSGSMNGPAHSAMPAVISPMPAQCTAAGTPRSSRTPPAAAPTMPPRLNMPCSDEMIGLWECASTVVACALIATSKPALVMPNSTSSPSSSA